MRPSAASAVVQACAALQCGAGPNCEGVPVSSDVAEVTASASPSSGFRKDVGHGEVQVLLSLYDLC